MQPALELTNVRKTFGSTIAVEGMNLVDVGPTILSLYDIEAPAGAVGRSFL